MMLDQEHERQEMLANPKRKKAHPDFSSIIQMSSANDLNQDVRKDMHLRQLALHNIRNAHH